MKIYDFNNSHVNLCRLDLSKHMEDTFAPQQNTFQLLRQEVWQLFHFQVIFRFFCGSGFPVEDSAVGGDQGDDQCGIFRKHMLHRKLFRPCPMYEWLLLSSYFSEVLQISLSSLSYQKTPAFPSGTLLSSDDLCGSKLLAALPILSHRDNEYKTKTCNCVQSVFNIKEFLPFAVTTAMVVIVQ